MPSDFENPPVGVDLRATFQAPKATDLLGDDLVVVFKSAWASGFRLPVRGDAHPDGRKYPNHKLILVEPTADGDKIKLTYAYDAPPRVSYETNAAGQTVTIVEQLVDEASPAPAPSALTEMAKAENLANGRRKQTVSAVDEVFGAASFEAQIPDIIPQEFKGIIPVFETYIKEAGIASMPELGGGDLLRQEKQVTKFVKQIIRRYRDPAALPVTLTTTETSEVFGFGGKLTLSRTLMIGEQEADEGYLVVDSQVKALGAGLTVKETRTVDAWPTLDETITDPVEGIVVDVEKRLVPAGTKYPGLGYTLAERPYTNITSVDKWRSIQIVSKVDLDTLPSPVSYGGSQSLSLPPFLLGVSALWNDESSRSASYKNYDEGRGGEDDTAMAQVDVQTATRGAIVVKTKEGFRGQARALITRTFLAERPALSLIPAATLIQPVTGTATIDGIMRKSGAGLGTSRGSYEDSVSSTIQAVEIGPVLTGALTGALVSRPVPFIQAAASANDLPDSGPDPQVYTVERAIWGGEATLRVEIPASTPAAPFASGTTILADSRLERWRFGIWVLETVQAIIP